MKNNTNNRSIQTSQPLMYFATMCCMQRVSEAELDAGCIKCSHCGNPAVVVDIIMEPAFADALFAAKAVSSPKAAQKLLGPEWKQISPWRPFARNVRSLQKLWHEYGADPNQVAIVRYLTSVALFAKLSHDDND